MLRLLLGRDWTANRDEILRRIGKDVAARRGNRILMVPELISHDMERRLCAAAGDTASRYAEVLSFTRLARRVSDSAGSAAMVCLDNGGRVVAMAAAARQLSSRLKAYAAVETRPEFLTGMIDAVDEFKRCCISPQDLAQAARDTEGSLSQKLEELSLLMESYDALCSRGKRDPRDQMTWLLEQLEEGTFAQDHVFYIDGFPDFTRQNLSIIEHLIRQSPEVTVSLNCDRIGSSGLAFEKAGATARELWQLARNAGVEISLETVPEMPVALDPVRERLFQGSINRGSCGENLRIRRCISPFDECMGAAEQVKQWAAQGCRYRDVSIVCTDMSVYKPLVALVFHRFGIPVYQSGTEQILHKSVISTVLTAMDAAFGGFEQRSVLQFLRSALSPLDPDLCDRVENYGVIWGIRGQKWTQPWVLHPDGLGGVWDEDSRNRLQQLEEARHLAMGPLSAMQKAFREAKDLRGQVLALYGLLRDLRLEEKLADLSREMDEAGDNRSAQILGQLWEILVSAMEQLYDVLGETRWEPEHFLRLFRLLLSQYDVGTIPPVLDAVQLGPVSAMRCNQEKHLIILGAEEGKFPGYSGSSGILTDQERVALRELGVSLTGGAAEGIQAEFAEIYGVFCGAMETVSVYCSGEQPSFLFHRLAEMAGSVEDYRTELGFAQTDDKEAAAYLAAHGGRAAAEKMNLTDAFEDACRRRDYSLGSIGKEQIRKLYGSTLRLSASQIERQAECRLSYFLQYGLQAKERKEIQVDPAEFGTYVHAVLENTVRCIMESGGFQKVTLEETLEIAHRFSDEYADARFSQIESERMRYLFRRNIRELDMVVEELWQELSKSQFRPSGFEVGFGRGDGLPAIEIANREIPAVLTGFVDRVDVWDNGHSSYYRVVDYKTGKKSFDYCDVFNGVGLQMLLYLFALRSSGADMLGAHPVPAGVQYFPARVPYLQADGREETEEALREREKQWVRSGLLLQDDAVLQAMEPGEQFSRLCCTVKKDGSLVGDLADREQMKLLRSHVFHVLGKLVEEIASGNVDANPYTRGTSHSDCAYCPYSTVCHADTVEGRRNYQRMTSEKFWEDVEREVEKHGR